MQGLFVFVKNPYAGDELLIYTASIHRKEADVMDGIFSSGSVPVIVAARVYGKDASWIRAGIISGYLPIGVATRNGKQITKVEDMDSRKGRINFYISPKRLYEETGYLWRGEKTYVNNDRS